MTKNNEVKEVKKDENKTNTDLLNSKKLKSFLQSAMNTATSLTNYIPKITQELIVVINQYQANQKDKITLKDQKDKFDSFKSLREVAKQKIAITSDATTMSNPSSRGYPLPIDPNEHKVFLNALSFISRTLFHVILLTSIFSEFP